MAVGRAAVPAPIALGVNLPSRIQNGQVGPVNPATTPAQGRAAPPNVTLLQTGPALPRQQTMDRQANALQEAQRVSTSQSKASPLAAQMVIEGVSFKTGNNVVPHGLGHPFRSCFLAGQSAAVTWYIQRPSGISADAYQVTIHASAPFTADVIVW